MDREELGRVIEKQAAACGYDLCGIIPIESMGGFREKLEERVKNIPSGAMMYGDPAKFVEVGDRYPWAKSVVICAFFYGRYRFPEELAGIYAKAYLLAPESNRQLDIYDRRFELEKWFTDNNIRFEGGPGRGHSSIGSLRYAAVAAGLGISRKNNFFYGPKGSYYALTGYVIDRECELIHETDLKPCPEKCDICRKACPTGSLCAPHTMDPFRCVSFLNTFGGGKLPADIKEEQMKGWVLGCDECQDACPFNRRHDWNEGEEIKALTEVSEKLLPENLLKEDDEFIIREVISRSDDHLTDAGTDIIRKGAERSLRYRNSEK